MGCGTSSAVQAAVPPASGGARQRRAVNYNSDASLWEALGSGDILLVRASWLVSEAERGGVLPRRQECPAEAFIALDRLKRISENSWANPHQGGLGREPVFAVSHFWRTKEHPDPGGETLQILGRALKERMEMYRRDGNFGDFGVFLDWCSLHQSPRSEAEEQCFRNALAWINLWYAHALTTVLLVTDAPEGIVAYHERGWTCFEYQLSWLVKLAENMNVWPQVVDLGRQPRGRPALAPPEAFRPGQAFGAKTFTNGADREKVARKFEEACLDIFGTATKLDYAALGWDDAEAAALAAVLPLCREVTWLTLGPPGATEHSSCLLPPSFRSCTVL